MNTLPKEFEEYIRAKFTNNADDLLSSLTKPPVASVRVNDKKPTHRFKDTEQVPWSHYGLYLKDRPIYTLDPLFHAGTYYVQEASSMFLEQIFLQHVPLHKALVVLDVCAAPGGKSTHILSLINKHSLLVANEVIKTRAHILSENIQKWGSANAIVTHVDTATFGHMNGLFDVVLVDVPCSGEGMFRKDMQARSEWSMANVKMCSIRQKKIVENIWPCLKEDGIMIYSTCTINEFENEKNIEWIKNKWQVEPLRININEDWGIEELYCNSAYAYRMLPGKVRGEGFFVSAFRKKIKEKQIKFNKKNKSHALHKSLLDLIDEIVITEGYYPYVFKEIVYLLPVAVKHAAEQVMNHLYVIQTGLEIGEVKKKRNLLPSHSLALSPLYKLGSYPDLPLETDATVAYLSKKNFELPDLPDGIYRVTFQNVGLGWIKKIQNRYNNYYPTNWRIRMMTEQV